MPAALLSCTMVGMREKKSTSGPAAQPAEGVYRFSLWKKLLCALAALAVAGGGAGMLLGGGDGTGASLEPAPVVPVPQPPGGTEFLPRDWPLPQPTSSPESGRTAAVQEAPGWSPALVRGGAGFFIGLCLGYALRVFLRASMFVAGAAIFIMVGLSYAGWIDVNWGLVERQMDALGGRLGQEVASFQAFLAGTLPSGALAALGLFTGFKKK